MSCLVVSNDAVHFEDIGTDFHESSWFDRKPYGSVIQWADLPHPLITGQPSQRLKQFAAFGPLTEPFARHPDWQLGLKDPELGG